MRTTLEIDEKLLRQAWSLGHPKTKRELIERSLEAFIRERRIERLLGKLGRFPLALSSKELIKLRAQH